MKKITFEEAYLIIEKYSRYFYHSGKFYSIAHQYEEGDMVQEICVKWLNNGYLDLYKEEITSVNYFIMTGVKHFYIDTLAKQRLCVSLDEPHGEDGLCLIDTLEDDTNMEKMVEDKIMYDELLEKLSDETNSKIRVITPMGEFKATMRTFFFLLMQGYTQAEITQFCKNPKSGKPITSGRVTQYVKELRAEIQKIWQTA